MLLPIRASNHVAAEIVRWVSEDGPRAKGAEIDIRGVGSLACVFAEDAIILIAQKAPAKPPRVQRFELCALAGNIIVDRAFDSLLPHFPIWVVGSWTIGVGGHLVSGTGSQQKQAGSQCGIGERVSQESVCLQFRNRSVANEVVLVRSIGCRCSF